MAGEPVKSIATELLLFRYFSITVYRTNPWELRLVFSTILFKNSFSIS